MDKEWIHLPSRLVPEYEEGVQKFLEQARKYAELRDMILCPCNRCKNRKYMKFDQVHDHLIIKGFDPSYTIWYFHGEIYDPQSQGEDNAEVQQNGKIKQLEQNMQEMMRQMQEMRSMIMHNQKQQEQDASAGFASCVGNGSGSSSDMNNGSKKSNESSKLVKSNSKNLSPHDIIVNTKCKLRSIDGFIVAEGRIASTDPNVKVHHVALGASCWKVWVDKVLVEKVDLIRPNSEMQVLDDAIGSTVAWFSKLVDFYVID